MALGHFSRPLLSFWKWALPGFMWALKNCKDDFSEKWPKKSGLLPVFANQKWAENFGGIF